MLVNKRADDRRICRCDFSKSSKYVFDDKKNKITNIKFKEDINGFIDIFELPKTNYPYVLAGDTAIIMPITENNEVIMIQEPRTPIGKTVLAFPAGMIEKGETP